MGFVYSETVTESPLNRMTTHHAHTQRLLTKIDCARVAMLIVEDNDASRRLVMELLRAAGFENLNFARDAEEAMEQMQAHDPDLLLLDWNLPGLNGIDLVRLIRASADRPDARFSNPHVPIIMLTARQKARDVSTARNAGVNAFVVKPFSTSALLKAIAGALMYRPPIIETPDFTGPDRRSRRAEAYPGLLRRDDDFTNGHGSGLFRKAISVELTALRSVMKSSGGIDSEAVQESVIKLLEAERQAQEFRLKLIEQATRSLNAYVSVFGDEADPEVLDVHIEALIQLNEVPAGQHAQAVSIVRHLNTLVTKRKDNRKSIA